MMNVRIFVLSMMTKEITFVVDILFFTLEIYTAILTNGKKSYSGKIVFE